MEIKSLPDKRSPMRVSIYPNKLGGYLNGLESLVVTEKMLVRC